jgi:HEPN domain-containing protein
LNLQDAYLDVAERSIQAAQASLNAGIHECSAFLAYHALESMGGAVAASLGQDYPRGHTEKINTLVANTNRTPFRASLSRGVATVAILVASLRADALYPKELTPTDYRTPRETIDANDARDLLRRVRGVMTGVQRHL